jgi:hypothetical protein
MSRVSTAVKAVKLKFVRRRALQRSPRNSSIRRVDRFVKQLGTLGYFVVLSMFETIQEKDG